MFTIQMSGNQPIRLDNSFSNGNQTQKIIIIMICLCSKNRYQAKNKWGKSDNLIMQVLVASIFVHIMTVLMMNGFNGLCY